MNVLDDRRRGGRVVDVVILARSRLPKTAVRPIAVSHGQPLDEGRAVTLKPPHRLLADRPLQVREDRVGPVDRQPRPDQQVCVFGMITQAQRSNECFLHRLHKPQLRPLLAQESEPPVAREGQKVRHVPAHRSAALSCVSAFPAAGQACILSALPLSCRQYRARPAQRQPCRPRVIPPPAGPRSTAGGARDRPTASRAQQGSLDKVATPPRADHNALLEPPATTQGACVFGEVMARGDSGMRFKQ